MLAKIEKTFPLNHPTGSGHFPGNPIIPGALLLAEVICAIEQSMGLSLAQSTLKAAKFAAPARPGDCVEIDLSMAADGQVKFHCAVKDVTVLSGSVKCQPLTTAF